MTTRQPELPSDRKFGMFLVAISFAVSLFFFFRDEFWFYMTALLGACLYVTARSQPNLLHPFNRLWTHLGILLGLIVGPLLMGAIFFGVITPTAVAMRIAGRDELRLRPERGRSHWIKRDRKHQAHSFELQF